MISLIKNELYKLFHKKSTIIVLVIVVLFQILTNYIYSYEPKFDIYDNNSENIAYLENEIKNIETNNGSVEDLVSYKTDLELMKTLDNYKDIEWKYELLNAYYYDILNNYYSAELITKDRVALEKYKAEKEEFIKNLDEGNWQYFATTQIKKNKDLVKDLEKQLSLTNSKKAKEDIDFQIKTLQKEIELETYRLDNKVEYTGYLNDAINNANAMYSSVLQYEKTTDKDEKEFLSGDVKSYYESMYILEHKVDVNNEATLQGVIKNLYYELSFMIFVFMIMISGSIVSEEFNKGTIKNLLTIPHTRSSILLSKYITVLLMIPFIVLFILLLEFVIGGAFFGFSSLNVPVLNYVIATGEMSAMNAVSYYLLIAVTKIPIVECSLITFLVPISAAVSKGI